MNPADVSIFGELFASLCEEMGTSLGRAAFSPNVKDRRDYSCALFDPQGRLVGQACHIPIHLGAMGYAVRGVVDNFSCNEGDVIIVNDPYQGGTHLPDITLIAPVINQGKRYGYVAARAHHADIGGSEPGSMAVTQSIEEEGIRILPTLLIERGVICESFVEKFCKTVRTPDEHRGDLRAQIAAIRTGERRLVALVKKHGFDVLSEAYEALIQVAQRHVQAAISTIPDGTYDFVDYLDGDGIEKAPLAVKASLTIAGATATVDFSGTAAACRGSLNCPFAVTASAVAYVFRCLVAEDCPSNSGILYPVRMIVPTDCLLNARYPAAVAAGNVETSQRIVDVVLGALAMALPKLIPAASCGSMNNVAIGGLDSRGIPFTYYETIAGGAGADPHGPGCHAVHTHMTNTLNTPVESLENHFPLRVVHYGVRRGSGGRGCHCGGDGVIREIEALAPCRATLLGERRLTRPWGLAGGESGQPGRHLLLRSGEQKHELPGKVTVDLQTGDRIRIETPGGGGYGVLVSDGNV